MGTSNPLIVSYWINSLTRTSLPLWRKPSLD
jgi:hypothetical protein